MLIHIKKEPLGVVSDFYEDFSLVDNSIFNFYDEHGNKHRDFLINFTERVKERCFVGCVDILDNCLSCCVDDLLLDAWGGQIFVNSYDYRESLCLINKYFNISSFYAFIYMQLDYDFFACFDEYLSKYRFRNFTALRYSFNQIGFTDVFDERFYVATIGGGLSYKQIVHKYDNVHKVGFSSTDSLSLLLSLKCAVSDDALRIFSYLLCKYRFRITDMLSILETAMKLGDKSFLEVLLNKYNFFDEKNYISYNMSKEGYELYLLSTVRHMLWKLGDTYEDSKEIVKEHFSLVMRVDWSNE